MTKTEAIKKGWVFSYSNSKLQGGKIWTARKGTKIKASSISLDYLLKQIK